MRGYLPGSGSYINLVKPNYNNDKSLDYFSNSLAMKNFPVSNSNISSLHNSFSKLPNLEAIHSNNPQMQSNFSNHSHPQDAHLSRNDSDELALINKKSGMSSNNIGSSSNVPIQNQSGNIVSNSNMGLFYLSDDYMHHEQGLRIQEELNISPDNYNNNISPPGLTPTKNMINVPDGGNSYYYEQQSTPGQNKTSKFKMNNGINNPMNNIFMDNDLMNNQCNLFINNKKKGFKNIRKKA
jgi:hypothetical protein